MPTLILSFKLPEETEDAKIAFNSGNLQLALHDIANEVFRPNRKHGYHDSELEDLRKDEKVCAAIDILEQMFYSIIKDRDISLD